jgi:glycosyltransferase involved in cell wall biosynthesis
MTTPLVSVVIPAYNAESTVLETIASVQRQSFPDWELIVVDDGSTDGTLARLRGVGDRRMRVLTGPNGGVAVARNRGLAESVGQFVTFLDADDLWTPDKLEAQLEALRRHPEAAVAYSWTAFVDRDGEFLFAKERSRAEGDVFAEMLLDFFVASASNVLIRRSCLDSVGDFNVSYGAAQDWDLCLRIAHRWPFVLVPRYQILYRVWERAMSADAQLCEDACLEVLQSGFASRPALAARGREAYANVKRYTAFLHLSRAGGPHVRRDAGRKLAESIRLHPPTLLTFRTWSLVLTWAALECLPAGACRPAVLAILRSYGRWLALIRRDVRELRAGVEASNRKRGSRGADGPAGCPATT